MNKTADTQKGRTWLHGVNVVIQQLVFVVTASQEIMLLYVSAWALRVPIFILWAMYLIAPFTYLRPTTKKELLRRYAIAGWLFVIGAIAWSVSYVIFCQKYGVPVSWDQVSDRYLRGTP